MDKKKRIVILATLTVLVVGLFGYGLFLQLRKNSSDTIKSTTYTDSISGDTVVTTDGVTPETDSSLGLSILGASNIQPLFGDDQAYNAFQNDTLIPYYKSQKQIKIAKDSVKKTIKTNDGITTITIDFNVYSGNNTTTYDQVSATYNQYDSNIRTLITKPDKTTVSLEASALGHD